MEEHNHKLEENKRLHIYLMIKYPIKNFQGRNFTDTGLINAYSIEDTV